MIILIFFKKCFKKNYRELDLLNKQIPPPKDITTGNQAAKIGVNKPFTPRELKKNDII